MHGYDHNLRHDPDLAATDHVSPTITTDRTIKLHNQSVPIVFDRCFGWYHPGRGQLGVVLCAPHGYEELCVHRHWRTLAQLLADQHMPTLRFDYPGTGDSADDDETPGRVRSWIDSIQQAVRTLRRIAGIDRVALVGLRMGALLATAAADQIDDLAALVLLAPIGSGEACFRELRALAKMRAHARPHNSAADPDAGLEAAGFVYTPQTIDDLCKLQLVCSGRPPAQQILLLNRPNAAPDLKFHARLIDSGAAVEEAVFADYPLLLRIPDVSVYPQQGFGEVVNWLAARNAGPRDRQQAMTRLTVLRLPEAVENPFFVNRSPDLFGVLCKPHGPARRTAVVFLNTGSNHHIGTSRMTVTMARNLARLGFTSLRLDISGIGDSDAPPGRLDDPTVEASSALDGLRDMGYESFIMIGLCSGAKLALETALRDHRIVGQILLNLQCYWKAPDASTGYMSRKAYFRMARQLSTWKRVARGGVDILGITKSIVHRSATAAAHKVAETWDKFRQKDSVRATGIAQFRSLASRGVQTSFVFVDEDPGLDELQIVFGRRGEMLRSVPNLSITILDEGDHIFSWDYSRKHLMSLVAETLTTMVPPAAADPSEVGT